MLRRRSQMRNKRVENDGPRRNRFQVWLRRRSKLRPIKEDFTSLKIGFHISMHLTIHQLCAGSDRAAWNANGMCDESKGGTFYLKGCYAALEIPTPEPACIPANAIGFELKLGIRVSPTDHFWILPVDDSQQKAGLRMSNGPRIVNKGFRGELIVWVDNICSSPCAITRGERLFKIATANLGKICFDFGEISN